MPLYEFRCNDCGIFDVWRSIAECTNPVCCPACNEPTRRVFSAPALCGSLRLKQENREPQLVKREVEPTSRVKSHAGRPWMIGH